MTFIYNIPDYEHSGDLEWAKREISKICEITNVKGFEERDYEAESDYASEYGECYESIFKGYVTFDADPQYTKLLEENGCYEY